MALPTIPTHDEVVKDKMGQLANVTTQAALRITPQILSAAANMLRESIGSENYDTYIDEIDKQLVILNRDLNSDGAFENSEATILYYIFDAKSFDQLTTDEKNLRNLIYAEAYFGLYYLAMALKKLVKGNSMTESERTTSTGITASPFGDIIDNMELYREQANIMIDSTGSGDGYTGGLGVFVV